MFSDRYRDFCARNLLPLHLQSWWLDAALGPDGWQAVFAGNPDKPLAAWPLPRPDRWRRMGLPPFTSYGGPWLLYPDGVARKNTTRFGYEKQALTELARALPRGVRVAQNLLPEHHNVLPLLWQGFRAAPRYTYLLFGGSGEYAWWKSLTSETRKKINAAETEISVEPSSDAGLLWRLHTQSLRRQGFGAGGSRQTFERLFAAALAADAGTLWVARRNADGQALAAQWVVRDHLRAHFVLSGRADDSGHAPYALLGHAVRTALREGLDVDFEGSMHPGVEHSTRQLGGFLTPYFRVRRGWWQAGA